MHDAANWPGVVRRMVPRMEGKGNLGKLMADMMAGVRSPSAEEERVIVAYLRKPRAEADRPGALSRAAAGPRASSFRLACNQCHVLPDPQRHSAAEWRAVVARMQENMAVDEPRGRLEAHSRRAAAARSRRSSPSWRSTRAAD